MRVLLDRLAGRFKPLAWKIIAGIALAGLVAIGVLMLANAGLRLDLKGKADELRSAQSELAAARAELVLLRTDAELKETASIERQNDLAQVSAGEKELVDAIISTPDGAPDLVRVRLGCQRLRRQGSADADLPAVCRSAG